MLNVGIIGLGVGEAHIDGYHQHKECKVTALCDFDPEKIKMANQKYPEMKITTKAQDILIDKNIDIVSIASYDNFHHQQILTAIENNKHIFVEKPLCLFKQEAQEIREKLQQKRHLKMSSNLILRKSPRFVELKEKISSGEFGQVYYVEGDYNYGRIHKIINGWRGQLDFYSVIHGGGVHVIDLLMWLTNENIVSVSAVATNIGVRNTNFKYNDTVVAIAKFSNGSIGKIGANFCCVYPHFHCLSVYGTKATFVNGLGSGKLYTTREPSIAPLEITSPYPGVHKGDLIYSFVNAICTNSDPEVSANDILKAMTVCFAIEEAVEKSCEIKIDDFLGL